MINVFLIGNSPSDCLLLQSQIPDYCTIVTIPDFFTAHPVLLQADIDLIIACPSADPAGFSKISKLVDSKKMDTACVFCSRDPEQIMLLKNDKSVNYEVLLFPDDLNDLNLILKKIARSKLQDFSSSRRYRLNQQMSSLVGNSEKVLEVKDRILKYSSAPGPVLITGESGTGKEITARLLHDFSNRKTKTFHAINAASIPKGLSASEFFGCEPGAYTGAVRRKGCFEHADGGSLFIDEIAELESDIQSELLRVLESGTVRKIGANSVQKVDVRLISATNKKLSDEVVSGRFRHDLLYRINMFRINIPPLRERKEDIPDLLIHLSNQLRQERPDKQFEFSDSFIEKLFDYSWPGNVRELKNIFWSAVYSSDTERLTAESVRFEP